MSIRSAVIQVEPDLAEAFNIAPKARQRKALSAFRQVLSEPKSAKSKVTRLSKKESELFLRINRTLTPEKHDRYEELTEKRLDESLTKSEHAELGKFIKEIEQLWGDRLQAVIELAKLRKITPQEMMKRLEIDPQQANARRLN
ncbi:MAG: hypothetical protein ABI977_07435 [Acidobacteriota bacterium]